MTESARTRRVVRCGNCEAEVAANADLCPRCGALLAAYRNPLDPADDLVLTVAPVGVKPPPVPAATDDPAPAPPSELPHEPETIAPPAVVATSVSAVALHEARARLVRTLAAPERELIAAISATVVPLPPAPAAPSATAPTRPISLPAVQPKPRRVVPGQPSPPVFVPAPRKPGFIVKGSVPVVLLWGVALIFSSCVVFLIASAAAGSRFATAAGVVGLLLGVGGAICIVFAMLVHLVRREADR